MKDVYDQLRADFRMVPELVDEYTVHTPRPEAIRGSRQVCGVTHYLSLMSTGEPDLRRSAMFGVVITCIDEVTDMLGEPLYPEAINAGFRGESEHEALNILEEAKEMAASDNFEYAIRQVGRGQDMSMGQLESPSVKRLRHITETKAGWSARANLAFVESDISEREYSFMKQFGFTMQLLDDYMDQPKDEEAGISTLFTAGAASRDLLRSNVRITANRAACLWGDSKAHERFFSVCRLHMRLGDLENSRPGTVSRLLPFYL